MNKWKFYEYILFPLITTVLFFALIATFNQKNQAITIGGDTFGHLAKFSIEKKGLSLSDSCLCYKTKDDGRFKPFHEFEKSFFIALSDSPVQFINNQFIAHILAPFFLAYFFARSVVGARAFSIPVSLIFALTISFSSYNILHLLTGHYSFFPLFNLVWIFLFYRFSVNPNNFNAAILGLAFGVNTIFNPYYGYFGLFLYLFFIGYSLLFDKARFKALIKRFAYSFALSGAIVILIHSPNLGDTLTAYSQPKGTVYNRSPLTITGVAPWNYFLPAPTHLGATENYVTFYRKMMTQSNVAENAVYLGFFNILFFGYGLYLFYKNKLDEKSRFWFRFVYGAAVFCVILSLPPNIDFGGGHKINLISPYLHAAFPMFRTFGRMGLFALIFGTIGSSFGLYHLLLRSGNRGKFVAGLAVFFVLVDLTPKLPTLDIEKHPPVYDWLKKQPGNFLIYEVPESYGSQIDNFQQYKFRYYQSIHGKKLANRGIRKPDPQSRLFYRSLKRLGVKYLIQHEKLYEEGPLPEEYKKFESITAAEIKFNGGKPERFPEWFVLLTKAGDSNVYELQ